MMDSKWLKITHISKSPSGTTDIYVVSSKRSRDVLGKIAWFGRWRQYTFTPMSETTFNSECLADIATECAALTAGHRVREAGA